MFGVAGRAEKARGSKSLVWSGCHGDVELSYQAHCEEQEYLLVSL